MSRALVLGGAGFVGAHMTRRLLDLGWDVTVVVRNRDGYDTYSRLGSMTRDVRLFEGDAFDPELLGRLVPIADAVFPFAGHSGAARSLDEPVIDASANAVGQLVVLEAIRRHNPAARCVFPGSRLQYGRARSLPVAEDHPQDPTSVYGLHKMVGERYHLLYHDLYGLGTCSLRISNPYGPGQDRPDGAFGVVGTFLATASRGEPIRLFGGGIQLRDYVYIDDLVELLLLSVTHPAAVGRAFNAGGRRATSLREMAETVVETVGGGIIHNVPWPAKERAVETGDYVSDIRAVGTALGWEPRVELRDGLERTWQALQPVLTLL